MPIRKPFLGASESETSKASRNLKKKSKPLFGVAQPKYNLKNTIIIIITESTGSRNKYFQ